MTGTDVVSVDLSFDNNVFSIDTIKRALYRFADRCSFDIQSLDQQTKVTLHITSSLSRPAIDDLCARIRNEVLDQDLRDTLSRETANIRTLILANAFSNTGLIES
ncbi:His-Xaa-Ser system protein HxsD [Methylobacter sp. YRD-M1]|uniref:His-Xaa-Ser system protein HxsD n=1 Tax=Methylobacter sp. YRD-M1 TaxID=2911520 RepID=UPI003FA357B7